MQSQPTLSRIPVVTADTKCLKSQPKQHDTGLASYTECPVFRWPIGATMGHCMRAT